MAHRREEKVFFPNSSDHPAARHHPQLHLLHKLYAKGEQTYRSPRRHRRIRRATPPMSAFPELLNRRPPDPKPPPQIRWHPPSLARRRRGSAPRRGGRRAGGTKSTMAPPPPPANAAEKPHATPAARICRPPHLRSHEGRRRRRRTAELPPRAPEPPGRPSHGKKGDASRALSVERKRFVVGGVAWSGYLYTYLLVTAASIMCC